MSQEFNNQNQQDDGGVIAPPKILLWGVIALFVLAIVGGIGGVWVFRDVLRPSQQQRVIDSFPFMRAFMRGGDELPTALPPDETELNNLLNAPLTIATSTPAVVPSATITSTPTIQIEPSATIEPTQVSVAATPTVPPPTPAPTVAVQPTVAAIDVSAPALPSSYVLGGITYSRQTWNNCGPANVTMGLSYYGWTDDQTVAGQYLKTDREDKNVTPTEMINFVNEESFVRALWRMGGNLDMLRTFIANDFPVIIESGSMPEGNDWYGHYQTVTGYDDLQRVFYVYDSYTGDPANNGLLIESYDAFDANWQAFNRLFIVLFPPDREATVREILGELADPVAAAEHALAVARAEATANPQNSFAWFNMGTSLARLELYEEAATAFDQARRVSVPELPWRMLWYQFGPYEAYYHVGRYDDVLGLINANLNNGGQYVEETFYWQGRVYEAQGLSTQAADSYRRALSVNSRYTAASNALDAIG